tara:strand:+ start:506 stop:706 length:201 start_codon:yes stop_codon:yes gene_type:complete
MNELVIRKKEVYGNVLNYPVCDKAKSLANLVGTKTLTDKVLNQFSLDFGFQIKIKSTWKELVNETK